MKGRNITFLVLLLLAFGIRLVWFFATDNAGNGDAAARLNVTQIWLYSNWQMPKTDYLQILNPSRDWLPLHFYLIGTVSYIFHDLIYTPRLFTLLFSVLTLIPLYKICLVRYNRSVANIAVAILAFYGMHVFLSTLILSETFYIFFIMWGYYFIEKYRAEETNTRTITLLSICLSACCLLRYEAWVFAPLVILTLPFIKKMSLKHFFILALIPTVAVCFVMLCFAMGGDHPLRGLLFSDFEVKKSSQFAGAPDYSYFLPAYLPAYLISAVLVLVYSLKTKKLPPILIWALYFLPICPFLVKLLNGTLSVQSRYLVIYMVPGIVLIAGLMDLIVQKFKPRNTTLALLVVVYILVANISFASEVRSKDLRVKYAPGLMHSALYFRDSVNQSKAYVDYGPEMSNSNWMVYADLYDSRLDAAFIDSFANAHHVKVQVFLDRVKKGARYRITTREYEWKTWHMDNFDKLLKGNEITHVVLFPDGALNKNLNFRNPHELYLGKKFNRIFSEDGYMIYRIEPDSL